MSAKTYKLSNRLFRYDINGTWFQRDNDIFSNGIREVQVFTLFDGTITSVCPYPFGKYREEVGRYVRDRNGTVIIKGIYPFYITDSGVPVYLDHDCSFSKQYVNFLARVQEHDRIRWQKADQKRQRKNKLAPTLRMKVKATSDAYRWSVRRIKSSAPELAYGYATVRVQAERDAALWVERYKSGQVNVMGTELPKPPDPSWYVNGDKFP